MMGRHYKNEESVENINTASIRTIQKISKAMTVKSYDSQRNLKVQAEMQTRL